MTTEPEYRIVAENVEKAFGDNKVLKGVSFKVARGSATTILGPSGSGRRRCCGRSTPSTCPIPGSSR